MYVLQMYYTLSRKNFPTPLLTNLPQINSALCDLKLVFDNGEVWIHRTALKMWRVWLSRLLQDLTTNIVLLPGVSMIEVEQFLGNIYRGKVDVFMEDDTEAFHGFTDRDIDIAESKRLNPIGKSIRKNFI